MPQASPQQHSFSGGEYSPLIYGRQDSERYVRGLRQCRNWIPLVQGPLTRRPGFVYAQTTKFGRTRRSRLFPFTFSTVQSYMLEFGHEYIRFFTAGGLLTSAAQDVVDVDTGPVTTLEVTGHGYSNGDRLLITALPRMPMLDQREVIVANATTDEFEVHDIYGNDIDSATMQPYLGGAHVAEIFEVTTPFEEDDLDGIRVAQSADVMYVVHPGHEPLQLLRTAPLTWVLATVPLNDGPYGLLNDTNTTLSLSTTDAEDVTITASATTGINFGDGFVSTDVGRSLRWRHDTGDWTWFVITAVNSTTEVVADRFGPAPTTTGATGDWRLGLWSDTTGWPGAIGFHEDRLWFGGAITAPTRLDGSRTGDYLSFTPTDPDGTVVDDHAISVTLSSGEVNAVLWLESDSKGLLVGTQGGEWLLSPSALNEPLTPGNTSARKTSVYGSSSIDARRVGNATLFVQRGARKLREMAYVFEIDGFRSPDISLLAEHLTRPELIRDMVVQRQPQPIVWIVRSDGTLVGVTYDREQDVIAWHLHPMQGEVEALGVTPDPSGVYDEVWAVVKREVADGDSSGAEEATVERNVEFMAKLWEFGDEQDDAVCLDAATVAIGPDLNEIGGLFHLEGHTVGVWADGQRRADRQVTGGRVTLNQPADLAVVGLLYDSLAETMPAEAGAADGSAQGKMKRISRVGFWLMDTGDLRFGPDLDLLTQVMISEWGQDYGTAPPLFTGLVREQFEGDSERLGQMVFRSDSPAPATVLSLMLQVNTQDDT